MAKKKYTKKDYEYVLNKILESWSERKYPNAKKMMKELMKSKKLMDDTYEFYKEMDE